MEEEAKMGKGRPTKLPSPQERLELILLGLARGRSMEALCQEAGVSRELFYRWMKRVRQGALQALEPKRPGPKCVKNVEQAAQKIQRMEARQARLEQQAASLRKERDHLQEVNRVARRIIQRQARDPASEASSKKNAMRTKPRSRSIANNGKKNASTEPRRGPSAPPGGFTDPRTGDGFEGLSGPDAPEKGGSQRP